MSKFKSLMKSRSIPAKIFFIVSLLFAGPVSFLLYDFYINWSQSSTQTISWYLAFAYDAFGAWGGVLLSMSVALACLVLSFNLHKRKQMYYWK